MRKKFRVYYSKDHPEKAGQPYKPLEKGIIVMNGQGIFFLFIGEDYYPSICKLSLVLPKYDVVWKED